MRITLIDTQENHEREMNAIKDEWKVKNDSSRQSYISDRQKKRKQCDRDLGELKKVSAATVNQARVDHEARLGTYRGQQDLIVRKTKQEKAELFVTDLPRILDQWNERNKKKWRNMYQFVRMSIN
mmetsp:Transcript_18847/g.21685  ORF Transcript_18847/g.21685 Transcript_18847/m.21685 type:complete len:125 (-) Transcript_18847:407-781(-)